MKNYLQLYLILGLILIFSCNADHKSDDDSGPIIETLSPEETLKKQVERGAYLVGILDCNVCHTPKIMTDQGPVPDESKLLSGHPAGNIISGVDGPSIAQKGYGLTNEHFTAWMGPWGVSYAANLTPDDSGLGSWSKENFLVAIKEGWSKGIRDTRKILPPMPWQAYSALPDEDLEAIFSYLQSIPAVSNVANAPLPPSELPK